MKKVIPPKIKKPVQLDERATEMVSKLALNEKVNQMSQSAVQAGKLPKQLRGALRDSRIGSVKLITK